MKESKKYATYNFVYRSAAYMCYIRGSEKIIGKKKGDVNNEKMEI